MFEQAFRHIDDVLRKEAGCIAVHNFGGYLLDFVLDQYVKVGVEELDPAQLSP
jgi:hypothetical protein